MEDAVARKEWAEVVVEEDTAELGVVSEEAVMGVVEVMAVAVEVDVAAAVLGTVVMVEGVVREVGGGQVEAAPKATASHTA